jgi:hypothetical protein
LILLPPTGSFGTDEELNFATLLLFFVTDETGISSYLIACASIKSKVLRNFSFLPLSIVLIGKTAPMPKPVFPGV